jgi:hypothetical protein
MRNLVGKMLLLSAALSVTPASGVRADETAPPPAAPPAETAPASAPAPAASISRARITAPPLTGPTIWGLVDWFGVGVGARYMFPVGIPSLLSHTSLKDSWAIEAGLDFVHRSDDYGAFNYDYNEFIPTVGMMWIVWLRNDFAVYPKIDGGWAFGFDNSNNNCVGCTLGGVWIEGAAGLLYEVGGGLTLRAELGNYGAKGGVAWLF